MAYINDIYLPQGYQLNLTSDAFATGQYCRLGNPGNQATDVNDISASTSYTIGPYNEPYTYRITRYGQGAISYTSSFSGMFTKEDDDAIQAELDEKNPIAASENIGEAEDGITAAEYGDAYQHTTVLTVDTVLPAIAGGADLSVGVLLYTLPAGACIIKEAYMNMAITQTEDNITADTPDIGLGTTIAAGANALLSDTAGSENILTGQTANDCDGTAEVKAVADQALVIAAAGDHTVYFNAADGWAADGDAAALLTGTVVLHWQFME